MMLSIARAVLLVAVVHFLGACQNLYYGTMEKLGQHKRDILVSRVEATRDDQEAAKEQFRSALDRFSEVVAFEGGDLRAKYDRLTDELERSEAKAASVRRRIAKTEEVAEALFDEWETELAQYSSDDLRRRSERALRDTQERYRLLITTMKRAEGKMEPVLVAFRDHVLFLKHNLNAQAVAALQGDVVRLESDISELIADMEAAISEADAFIAMMGSA
ncbi:MAG: DUF2959 domain-containing protein [Planctomycetota bacterium]|jgi:SMC interacting uncharacterized protein involved in chromosome segregation